MSIINRNSQINKKIEDIVKELGAELLEFKIHSSSGKNILYCIVDLPEGGITLDRCAVINKRIVVYLEDSGDLGSDYELEVNSPGLDRKLNDAKSFFKAKGRNISLWLSESVEGKDYLEGQILAVNNEKLSLGHKGKIIEINFDKIKVGKEKIEIK